MAYKRTAAGSYSRNCRWCGRRIQMRNMGGHFVAWEGDAPHECQHPPANAHPLWVWPESKVVPAAKATSDSDLPEFRSFTLRRDAAAPPARVPGMSVSSSTTRPSVARLGSTTTQRSTPQPAVAGRTASASQPVRPSGTSVVAAPRALPKTAVVSSPARRPWLTWLAIGVGAVIVFGMLQSRATPVNSASPVNGTCPAGYPVKGNDGQSGHIYHVPGGQFYNATRPERCFSDGAAAEAAGYRRSQR